SVENILPPVYDQGHLGSCVANSVCAAYVADRIKESQQLYDPSRLFLYYNARAIIDQVRYDSGCYIRDAIKTLSKDGVCLENCWPYSPTRYAVKPPSICFESAK